MVPCTYWYVHFGTFRIPPLSNIYQSARESCAAGSKGGPRCAWKHGSAIIDTRQGPSGAITKNRTSMLATNLMPGSPHIHFLFLPVAHYRSSHSE
ncbi:unnamed protein product [Ectocarpus sp. CCAP 1310/34]|nr:unnamed protein product [Ectocarpus sp. CCAP 1310/34]